MAKSAHTFQKRQREKDRQKKNKEKRERREERKQEKQESDGGIEIDWESAPENKTMSKEDEKKFAKAEQMDDTSPSSDETKEEG